MSLIRRTADRFLRWSRKTRGRDSVSGERPAREECSARAHARGRRALLPLRRAQPHQRSEPGFDRRAAAGGEDADLLGQSQLASHAGRHHAPDARRRCQAGSGVRNFGVRIVLRMPAVHRGHRTGSRTTEDRQNPALLSAPEVSRSDDGSRANRVDGVTARAASVHRAQRAGVDGRVESVCP